jgi:hypothetical protein
MPTVAETQNAKGRLAAPLAAGVDEISQSQTITFTLYRRLVLPMDGFIFWVKADLLGPSATVDTTAIDGFYVNQGQRITTPAQTLTVAGSFHYASTQTQQQDENYVNNRVIFTALSEVHDFNDVDPTTMYIGTFDEIRFAFSQRSSFYKQADLYHYTGDAVYSILESQIIDDLAGFDPFNVVTSNSLPAWLTLNSICPVFPSYLVPDNQTPPYVSIHIAKTEAIQATPLFDNFGSQYQLAKDNVTATVYGLRNFNAQDFYKGVLDYIGPDGQVLGLMNMPIIQDEKTAQVELTALAMKKTIKFEVSYYQARMRDVAVQYILHCVPKFVIEGLV